MLKYFLKCRFADHSDPLSNFHTHPPPPRKDEEIYWARVFRFTFGVQRGILIPFQTLKKERIKKS